MYPSITQSSERHSALIIFSYCTWHGAQHCGTLILIEVGLASAGSCWAGGKGAIVKGGSVCEVMCC